MEKELTDVTGSNELLSFREKIFLSLLLCNLIPFVAAFFFATTSAVAVLAMGGSSLILSFLLLTFWEGRMRRAVTLLVRRKIDLLDAKKRAEDEEKLKNYESELKRKKSDEEELKRAFENKVDFLRTLLAKSEEGKEELQLELDEIEEKSRSLSIQCEDFKIESERLKEESEEEKEEFQIALQQKDTLLSEYQQTILEQRLILEKKQRYIAKLESRVHDLMVEVRSLLQIDEAPAIRNTPPVLELPQRLPLAFSRVEMTLFDLSLLLQKYIALAENFNGPPTSSHFPEMDSDRIALDVRRLADVFREERQAILFFFSPLERKVLFANPKSKTILGWNPERFAKHFFDLIARGSNSLREAFRKVGRLKEGAFEIAMKSKENEELCFQGMVGLVTRGPFSGYIVGILSQIPELSD